MQSQLPLINMGVQKVRVDAILFGTITRDDGSLQVTYNGWPLYYFYEDAAPGDTNGQAWEASGSWFHLRAKPLNSKHH